MCKAIQLLSIAGISLGLTLAGCTNEDHDDATTPAVDADTGDDGRDGTDRADHPQTDTDHPTASPLPDSGARSDAHAGDSHTLGTVTIAGATLDVSMTGAIAPKADMHFDIVQTSGPTLATLRLWIGEEAAIGSLKSKSDAHDKHFHAHVKAPNTLSMDSRLWLEAQDASGTRQRASLPLNDPSPSTKGPDMAGHPPFG